MLRQFSKILKDQDLGEIIKKGVSFFIFSILGLVSGYLYTLFIARNFGAAVNGLIGISFSIFMIIAVIGKLGIDTNLTKFYASDQNLKSDPGIFYRFLGISVLFSCLLSFLIYFFKQEIAISIFKKEQLIPFISWTAYTIPLWVCVVICASIFKARKATRTFGFLNRTGRFLFSFLLLILLFLWSKDSLITIQAHFFAILILAIISLIMVTKQFNGITLRPKYNSRFFFTEAFPMMLSSAIIILLGWIDTFILGIYEDESVVGVYTVALKIATLTTFSLQAIDAILAPKIAEAYRNKDYKNFKRIIQFSTKLNFFLTLLVVIGIISFHHYILSLFGEEFTSGSIILIVLCIGQFINSFSGSVAVILQMTGHQIKFRNLMLTALCLNIILNIVLAPLYGALGVAFATVITMALWNILGAIYLKKKLGIISYYNFR